MDIAWYVDLIDLKDEITKLKGTISSKETRSAILESITSRKNINGNESQPPTKNDKMFNELEEKERLNTELPKLKSSLLVLEDRYNLLLKDLEVLRNDEKSKDYLELNIFYYKFIVYQIYTLEDIREELIIPYQESQVKLKSTELNKKINSEIKQRNKNRTLIVL